jgi:trans-aconitate methyltransferase
MKLNEAAGLLKNDFILRREKQVWADLGCGSGTFTNALALLLPDDSIVYAVDKNKSLMERIPDRFGNSAIIKIHGDFTKKELRLNLDGILMANSLHYVKDQKSFIDKILNNLNHDGCLLIVEYDLEISTPWIPYPVSLNSLKDLFNKEKYEVIKLGDHPSVYRKEKIYSALIKKI